MKNLIIDLEHFEESKLSLDLYIPLQIIIEISSTNNSLPSWINLKFFEKLGWIKIDEEGIPQPRQILIDLFKNESNINFDDFWNIFPARTKGGRILRAAEKEFHGSFTRDYTICKKKYLSKIKSAETHERAINAITARVHSGDIEYLNNMETYINQSKWESDAQLINKTWQGTDI